MVKKRKQTLPNFELMCFASLQVCSVDVLNKDVKIKIERGVEELKNGLPSTHRFRHPLKSFRSTQKECDLGDGGVVNEGRVAWVQLGHHNHPRRYLLRYKLRSQDTISTLPNKLIIGVIQIIIYLFIYSRKGWSTTNKTCSRPKQ